MPSSNDKPIASDWDGLALLAMTISAGYGLFYILLSAWSTHNTLPSDIAQKSLEIAFNIQIIHTLTLLCLGGLTFISVFRKVAKHLVLLQYVWIFGILLFSGMIYLKHLVGISSFGLVTPLGGLLLIIGWLWLGGVFAYLFFTSKTHSTTEGQNK